jgi:threonine/homoserine/homoserine lactone efflux protein
MTHLTALWLFFLLVAGIVALPGLDMAFVLASAASGGRRAGFAAIGGIVAGGIVHVVMATLGIAVVLRVIPGAFNAVLVVGAAYMGWIGWSIARRRGAAAPNVETTAATIATFRRGALTNLLNPKAYLFTLAVFPQFMRSEFGPLWLQAAEMSAIIIVTQVTIYGAVALVGGRWLQRSPVMVRGVGVLLIALSVTTLICGVRL